MKTAVLQLLLFSEWRVHVIFCFSGWSCTGNVGAGWLWVNVRSNWKPLLLCFWVFTFPLLAACPCSRWHVAVMGDSQWDAEWRNHTLSVSQTSRRHQKLVAWWGLWKFTRNVTINRTGRLLIIISGKLDFASVCELVQKCLKNLPRQPFMTSEKGGIQHFCN